MIDLHPDHVAAMYDCLRSFDPFKRWRLPLAEAVEFHIRKIPADAWYQTYPREMESHAIFVNPYRHGYFNSLAMVTAHEMIHLHQRIAKLDRGGEHNADFRKKAKRICEIHGWDVKQFI
jgi:hypothetical protein